jgi:hypothetical protein
VVDIDGSVLFGDGGIWCSPMSCRVVVQEQRLGQEPVRIFGSGTEKVVGSACPDRVTALDL